ncbi:hypothetical protein ACS0TY_025989 [Phlomoides rotata]
MEFYSNEQGYLEELLGLREMGYNSNQDLSSINLDSTTIFDDFSTYNINYSQPIDQALNFSFYSTSPFGDELSHPDFTSDSSNTKIDSQTVPYSQYCSMPVFDDEPGFRNRVPDSAPCKFEPVPELPAFNMGFAHESERKNKVMKKENGQPSKNLMAERRRRKRLNDRLAMLRSVVPKISKMDRTSILGDTIDYMKEVLERINCLQAEMGLGENELGLFSIFDNVKPEEILIRNSPKFDVERRSNSETRIAMCCAGKPGLLLSTVTTLEGLGMDIQQCVISCFNDFAMQASCSHEEAGQKTVFQSEEIKEALFRNAGYGGRCL